MSQKRIRTHVNPLSFHQKMAALNFNEIFAKPEAPLHVEIGTGKGVFLRHFATAHPEENIIGVEVRRQIVDWVQQRLTPLNLTNAHLVYGAGERCLEDQITDHSLSSICIFHPDPWLKDRHHKRRVIRPEVLTLFAQKLKPGGLLRIATDVDSLWGDIQETVAGNPQFKRCDDEVFWKNDYTSHWDLFSEKDGRSKNQGSYRCHNP
jgi:tRNA (guanine-N7-)-methyltransferase